MNGKDFAQDAADKLNATADSMGYGNGGWSADEYGEQPAVSVVADTLAELAEVKADLAEIARIIYGEHNWQGRPSIGSRDLIATIAAKYRETDPLLDEARAIVDRHEYTFDGLRNAVNEALKRGVELAAELDKRGLVVGVKS